MDKLTRNVIARYREDFDEKPPDQQKPWMDYLKEKNDEKAPPESAVKILKSEKGFEPEHSQYNPYDYEDPSEKPKDPKGPPFVNQVPPVLDYGLFQTPKLFLEQGELEEWLQAQRQDVTENPQDQFPAMSLDCKYAHNVVARHLLDVMPIIVAESDLSDLFMRTKVAATLDEIVDKDYHYLNDKKMDRAEAVNAVWMNKGKPKDREKGLFVFRVTSPNSEYGSHTVYLQFLRGEEEKQYESYASYPVQLACTCPSFLFHGAQFYAIHDRYMFMPAFRPGLVAPKPQDAYVLHSSPMYPQGKRFPGRGLNFRVCKHLLKVYDLLKTLKIEEHYRKYPVTSPPSEKMNAEVWKKLMKTEFTEENIRKNLKSPRPVIPAYFNREKLLRSVIDWFEEIWYPKSDDEKMKILKELTPYPERIYFILLKEAYMKRAAGEQISDELINEGFRLMDSVIQKDNKLEPESIKYEDMTPEEEKQVGTGGISPPGGEEPADEFIKKVEPSTAPTPSELAPSTLRPKKTPEEKKKDLEERQKELRERGISDRAKKMLQKYKKEEVEPRKEEKRQRGLRPFYDET